MTDSYDEYADLQGAGFTSPDPVPPEEEFFHLVIGINSNQIQ